MDHQESSAAIRRRTRRICATEIGECSSSTSLWLLELMTSTQTSGAPLQKAPSEARRSNSHASDEGGGDPEKTLPEKDGALPPTPELSRDAQSKPADGSTFPPLASPYVIAHLSPIISRQRSLPGTEELSEPHQQLELEKTRSKPISLSKSADGTILIDWYTAEDPDNPQNWSQRKKMFVLVQICLYAFAMYGGSSIVSLPSSGRLPA